jgi:hypothetical protein
LKPYFEKRKKEDEIVRAYIKIGVISVILLILLFVINNLLIVKPGDKGLHPVFYILFVFISILIANFDFSKKATMKMTTDDKEMIKIFSAFLEINKKDKITSQHIIVRIFNIYDEKEIKKILFDFENSKSNVDHSVKKLSGKTSDIKMFVVYTLMDICMIDGLYSENDELFIEDLKKQWHIPDPTLYYIKSQYKAKGMIEEKEIQDQQTAVHDYTVLLPYEAFKILGLSSNITKVELKKAYRVLAKKYHPDKFYGQSPEKIKKAEEQFEEIKKAYETIKLYMNIK